jgi:hypothetical protein
VPVVISNNPLPEDDVDANPIDVGDVLSLTMFNTRLPTLVAMLLYASVLYRICAPYSKPPSENIFDIVWHGVATAVQSALESDPFVAT